MAACTVAVLGGSGFIGRATVATLVREGNTVIAPVRSDAAIRTLIALGASARVVDYARVVDWIGDLSGADAVIDLRQPPLPKRLTVRAMRGMARQRIAVTRSVTEELVRLAPASRPLWISVSGTDELDVDAQGRISGESRLRASARGFGRVGIPVRAVVAGSGLDATYVHFGQMVYGPGKGYVSAVVEPLRAGKARVVGRGDNLLPLTHVDDAAAALAHVVGLDRASVAGQTVVTVPALPATQRQLYELTAVALGTPGPARAPAALARLVAGRAAVEGITFDARCEPDLLTRTGFRFMHETLQSGVRATIAALGVRA